MTDLRPRNGVPDWTTQRSCSCRGIGPTAAEAARIVAVAEGLAGFVQSIEESSETGLGGLLEFMQPRSTVSGGRVA